jgi:hypothetical protein
MAPPSLSGAGLLRLLAGALLGMSLVAGVLALAQWWRHHQMLKARRACERAYAQRARAAAAAAAASSADGRGGSAAAVSPAADAAVLVLRTDVEAGTVAAPAVSATRVP